MILWVVIAAIWAVNAALDAGAGRWDAALAGLAAATASAYVALLRYEAAP